MSNFPSFLRHNIIAAKLSGEMPTYFNREEMTQILTDELRDRDYQTWFLIYLLYHTGARISEAVGDHETVDGVTRLIHPGIYVHDIDFHHRVIRLKTLKRGLTSKTRKTYAKNILPVIKPFPCTLRDNGFITIQKWS